MTRAMAQFFEKLEADSKGKNPPEFFRTTLVLIIAWSE